MDKDSPVLAGACGTGFQIAAVKKCGANVTGNDASGLQSTFHNRFSMVFCCGNAINHCESTAALRSEFDSMRSVIHPGGHIEVSCSNWEEESGFHEIETRYYKSGSGYYIFGKA